MSTSSILILGAGRSSSSLITRLLQESMSGDFQVTVGDISLSAAREKAAGAGNAIQFNIEDTASSTLAIQQATIVISLLPPHLHILVAAICLEAGKHLLTASYVSHEMQRMHERAKAKGLLFLNECGLDPGIDHMSAMQVIDRIREMNGTLVSFESYTGGLIAPETDPQNPWRYKFTWNPRNVVMAGQGTAKFLQEGVVKYIPYQQLFRHLTKVKLTSGTYEGYVNRDSLKYREAYGLQKISTMMRGTLRNEGYCHAWDVLVQLGCTDDTYAMESVSEMTHIGFINSFLTEDKNVGVKEKIASVFQLDPLGAVMNKLTWSGFFDEEIVGLASGTPAQVLEHILNKKWKLNAGDKDLVVMWHRFVFDHHGTKKEIQSSLVATGEDAVQTAMAKTVGLPLAIAALLLLKGSIKASGVVIPTIKEIYNPVLLELSAAGIRLTETES